MVEILHNPRCRKSRETLELVREKHPNVVVREYLKNPLSVSELGHLVKMLGISAEELVRKKEATFITLFKGKTLTESDYLQMMAEHPILMERPVVINDKKAAIGRPPEQVLSIL